MQITRKIIKFLTLLLLVTFGAPQALSYLTDGPIESEYQVESGRLERLDFFSDTMARDIVVDVWLPETYNPDSLHPVVYMNDGQALFSKGDYSQSWQVDRRIKTLIDAGYVTTPIVVGVRVLTDRHSQYTPTEALDMVAGGFGRQQAELCGVTNPIGDLYVDYIADMVKPVIDSLYSTDPRPEATIIAGSSMGGLISMYGVCRRPEVFGAAGCMSTHWPYSLDARNSFFPALFTSYLMQHVPLEPMRRFYFDAGTRDYDEWYHPYFSQIMEILSTMGYDEEYLKYEIIDGGRHLKNDWSERLLTMFPFLLPEGEKVYPDTIYIGGDVNGFCWNLSAEAMPMAVRDSTGVYAFDSVAVGTPDREVGYMSFFTRPGALFEDANLGHRYGAVKQSEMLLPDEPSEVAFYPAGISSDKSPSWAVPSGLYNMSLDLNEMTLTISEIPPIEMYLTGDFNDWAVADSTAMMDRDSTHYSISRAELGGRIMVMTSLDSIPFGADTTALDLPDGVARLVRGSDVPLMLPDMIDVAIDLDWDGLNDTIEMTVVGTQLIPERLYLLGDINGSEWSPVGGDDPAVSEGIDGVFEFPLISLDDRGDGLACVIAVTNLGEDWDAVNAGRIYGAAPDCPVIEDYLAEYPMMLVTDSVVAQTPFAFIVPEEVTSVRLNLVEMTAVFTANTEVSTDGEDNPGDTETYYDIKGIRYPANRRGYVVVRPAKADARARVELRR